MSLSDLVTMTTSMGSSMNPLARENKRKKARELLGDAKRTRDKEAIEICNSSAHAAPQTCSELVT